MEKNKDFLLLKLEADSLKLLILLSVVSPRI